MSHLYKPSQDQYDAFGRLRVSNPLTLFDSSHRYRDNNLWNSLIVGSGSTVGFVTNQGLIHMTVGVGSTASVIRETTKTFSYQPGKSLLTMNTFVMNPPKQNLRQRVGYFGADNGIYFEVDGTTAYFVERSLSLGTETRISQSNWNIDKLDGTGVSGITLDVTKAQILWMDIEWLGLGNVRLGFIINGKFVHAHTFQHANLIQSTYITTASLPLRYEISNTGITTSASTLKQVCSTVISEGGYELRGLQQAVSTPITAPDSLRKLARMKLFAACKYCLRSADRPPIPSGIISGIALPMKGIALEIASTVLGTLPVANLDVIAFAATIRDAKPAALVSPSVALPVLVIGLPFVSRTGVICKVLGLNAIKP